MLYYYGARYYSPETGRFIQPDNYIDGATSTQGWNRYMYVHGNPVSNSDPSGNSSSGFGLYYGQSGYDTYYDSSMYGYSGASVDYVSRMHNSSLNSMMSWGSRPMHQQFSNNSISTNQMSQISNWSASANGPAVTSDNSNYEN